MSNPHPERTKKWYFHEYLPEPYRSQAIDNTDYDWLLVDSLSIALRRGFVWEQSPQGHAQWEELYNRIESGEFNQPQP